MQETPSTSRPICIALVEDDVHFQNALLAVISGAPDMRLHSVSASREQGLQALGRSPADVLLVDLGLPDGSGIDIIRAAHTRWPNCNVMVCTTFGDEANVMQSIEAGAAGYLLKDSSPPGILGEIRSLAAGGSPISPLIARQILTRFRHAQPVPASPAGKAPASLSEREHQVLELIAKGFTAEEIAGLIKVSRHTVHTYVRRIYSKLEVNSKAEAIFEAHHQGLLRD